MIRRETIVCGEGDSILKRRGSVREVKRAFFNFYEYKNRNLMGRMTVTRGGDSREGKVSGRRGNMVSIDLKKNSIFLFSALPIC
jgi:hypothetical protein